MLLTVHAMAFLFDRYICFYIKQRSCGTATGHRAIILRTGFVIYFLDAGVLFIVRSL